MIGRVVSIAGKALLIAGAVSGALRTKADGSTVTARPARLVASVTALVVALLTWVGVPEPVAQAAADVLVQIGLTP